MVVQVPGDCSCTRISVSSEGEAAATQSDKMGLYYLYGYHDGKVTNIHNLSNKVTARYGPFSKMLNPLAHSPPKYFVKSIYTVSF